MELLEIDLLLIHPSPTNPRKTFPADEMAEMIDSVKRHGVLQPILVRPWPKHYAFEGDRAPTYELIAGERRYRASVGAKLECIPAMVRDMSDKEVLESQIIENLKRKDVHPIEEGDGYELMIKHHGYTADQLGEKIGLSRAYIYGRMKLTALCDKAREAFREGLLTASTALLVARIPGAALQEKATHDITKTWQGVLNHRAAAQHIQSNYCLHLSRAAFPRENALLVSGAGTCTDCPKRSGNNPELYADIESADVCTDPDCHKAKSEAWLAYQLKQAEEDGKKVISGEAARKIGIAQNHDKYVPLDRKNYTQEGAPTYREIIANTGAEVVLIEDRDSGKLVEAVERKELSGILEAAGVKPERDYRSEERELERKVRAENIYRGRLFAAWHNEMRDQLATDNQPDFEPEELRLVVAALWANMSSESVEVVMIHWAKPSDEKEHWQRRHAMVQEITKRIPTMSRRELILLACDCALASDGRASAHSVDRAPANLIERARVCGIDADRIRAEIEAEKAAKTAKSTAKKMASTPSKAPLGGEAVGAKKEWKVGDRVRIVQGTETDIQEGAVGRLGVIDQIGKSIINHKDAFTVVAEGDGKRITVYEDELDDEIFKKGDPVKVRDTAVNVIGEPRVTRGKVGRVQYLGCGPANAPGAFWHVEGDDWEDNLRSEWLELTTAPEAPPAGATEAEPRRFKKGERVRVKADARGPNGMKRKCAGREGVIDILVATSATPGLEMYVVAFVGHDSISGLRGEELELLPTPTQAAPASEGKKPSSASGEANEKPTAKPRHQVEYRHPKNKDLEWSGRGRKPKWVENWLAEKAGRTLDELRVPQPEKKQSSAGKPANAKPSVAETVPRCDKTLELALV